MINRAQLLADLQAVLRKLEADLRERSEEMPEVSTALTGEHQRARKADRTAQNYEDWRSDYITQIAAAWVLSCVFVRFLEDNHLIDPPKIAGPDERLARARDEHEIYFRAHPTETDREYLLHVFDELARLPGTRDIFGVHNPIYELPNWLSGDAAGELLKFFQKIDANTGGLIHDFTDRDLNTRFLGDLYQDLSEAARKKYALLQTPEFVEEFILDRTLAPAIEEFSLEGFRIIDPACGSGHFLLGSFMRLLDCWLQREPGTNARELVQRALSSVYGVDINPYALAIARFRLLLVAMKACDVRQLAEMPAFHLNLACGDSLLHGAPGGDQIGLGWRAYDHVYQSEDLDELRRILRLGVYHVVVANPPYIQMKDQSLNQAYRERYPACHGKYALTVPFAQRIFSLCLPSGYSGQITANSFMKREFGKKLIESFFANVDLTHIIDTSGAYIPGHGTPTVILIGRNQSPRERTIRVVMGIRGEQSEPSDPASAIVWSSIVTHTDLPNSHNDFISVADVPREQFAKHPWSIGGGGASELKAKLDQRCSNILNDFAETAIGAVTLEDEAYAAPAVVWRRKGLSPSELIDFVEGDRIREWRLNEPISALFPYDKNTLVPALSLTTHKALWPLRSNLRNRMWFRKTQEQRGLAWYEYGMLSETVILTKVLMSYGFVATHNHFIYDRGFRVFKQTAPVIKLRTDLQESEAIAILGILNSCSTCFWLKQVTNCKGLGGQGGGIKPEHWCRQYEFDATKVKQIPLPVFSNRLRRLAGWMVEIAGDIQRNSPNAVIDESISELRGRLSTARLRVESLYRKMVAIQEEIDWEVYECFGLCETSKLSDQALAAGIHPEVRPVEQRLKQMLMQGEASIFYEVHRYRGAGDTNGEIFQETQKVINERLHLIDVNPEIELLESLDFKRRWQVEPWEEQVERSLRSWLLDRLERYFDFDGRMNGEGKSTAKIDITLISISRLTDMARQDADFMQVGELYCNDPAFDVARLVIELVETEGIPLLPVLRYQPSGMRKRREWEQTWDLQRQEDAIDARTKLPKDDPQYLTELQARELKRQQIGDISVPPKYTSSDFASSTYWRLRGKLDVPKERWVSFSHCEGADSTLMIAWAGYNHLQLARAISAYYVDIQERLGGRDDPRLAPLLACLIELLPWLKQWHNEVDPEFGMQMGDYFEGFIQEEARQMGKTLNQIRAWEPPKKTTRRRKRAAMES